MAAKKTTDHKRLDLAQPWKWRSCIDLFSHPMTDKSNSEVRPCVCYYHSLLFYPHYTIFPHALPKHLITNTIGVGTLFFLVYAFFLLLSCGCLSILIVYLSSPPCAFSWKLDRKRSMNTKHQMGLHNTRILTTRKLGHQHLFRVFRVWSGSWSWIDEQYHGAGSLWSAAWVSSSNWLVNLLALKEKVKLGSWLWANWLQQ